MGKVYLVGAGPGDPGLITVKGRDLLQAADCVLYDYLVNPALLEWAKPEAELHFVGKQGGNRNCTTQEAIHALLVEKARQYACVVRLKGGDPFIFGRGGEEALHLKAAGIAWEVVPGVTSGIAAAAYAGIPLTQRGISSSVTFLTAHEDPNKAATTSTVAPFAPLTLAAPDAIDTLVIYMGIARLRELAEALCASGRAPTTPVAVIRWGTCAQQEVFTSDLQMIASLAASHSVQAPAIIVVGEVVHLREQLQWFVPSPNCAADAMATVLPFSPAESAIRNPQSAIE